MTRFTELGLDPAFDPTLATLGITEPTPVQMQAIPLLLAGRDLIATAPTGTGKTAAFLLPAMQRLASASPLRMSGPRILVLTPTRELAQQVSKAAIDFGRALPRCRTICITGGESYITQNKALAGSYDILVATPGRLMDQMNSGRIVLANLEVLVLDEADRMLDMGFADDVLAIAKKMPKERQTVCFTATLSADVQRMSRQLQNDPQTIAVEKPAAASIQIDQHVFYVDDLGHKRRLLNHWLTDIAINQALVFTATKRDAEELAASLEADGHSTVALHGDLPQKHRTRMMNAMRHGQARILVATDVASRGIDVPAITHVFNFDMPKFAEDYVHRIGRTGRAGASGTAISFVNRNDVLALQKIERLIGHKVTVSSVVGMEARFKPGVGRPAGKPAGKFGAKPGGKFAGKPGSKPAFGKPAGAGRAGASQKQPWQDRKAAHATPRHADRSSSRGSRAGYAD
ncbi:MAG: DEAD/DEAH box helicase [Gammaproteobacteria bacterium]|nr:DEAD/DEAH box helicase [Gammaproteobacteria bacterium]MBU3989766.1 DEAD/DEAH box helicase [Gammaproteobacteria bacterium]MBU4005878.1 DEAD/DEAH box helicase [Gammaproteobacteria bacterium]MBU4021440.1 DEAD/DEAH box helicase [Gammaproteobacteria bacterium]MBU4097372.1 DEAD/DEAH box helicase [Gammaproteobacteria bacterium]